MLTKNNKIIISFFIWLCLLSCRTASSYKILIVCHQFMSHVIRPASIGSVLLKAGHEVHVVLESKFEPKFVKKLQNEGFIIHFFEENDEEFDRLTSVEYKKYLENIIFNVKVTFGNQVAKEGARYHQECDFMMKDEKFLQGLQEVPFDLAIAEPFLFNMCTLILPKYLNIPFVSYTFYYVPFQIRSPALPSMFPRHWFSIDHRKETPFHVRFSMLLISIFLSTSLSGFNANLTLLHKYAPGLDSWEDLLRESLLFFYDSDHHFNNFMPCLPNHIPLEAITSSPAKPLPDHLLEFINGRKINGEDPGVILMTFGSTADFMPREITKKFLNAFAFFNETILAKFAIDKNDKELISLIPPNLLILDWLPQNDLLGHPSTKLFITHCGTSGQHEALYHGIPMLGIPMFSDQDINCLRMVALRFGKMMNILSFTETELKENILEVMHNPEYKRSIRRMSDAMKDLPMTSQEKVLFWIEHVIKHGGSHLRSSAMDLPLYQFLCLDTVAVLVALVALLVYATAKMLRFLFGLIFNFCKKFSEKNKMKKQL